ncbi:hypothetical protein XI04_27515 [Bradyrhizobium sp. CCBAU 11430]|nr:hypothetical protein [Bradyrhizobium sp. CCBAU 25360]MDA9516763.1 hypothetical protein [Bradyrhizobium sp. CCBAU 11430]
MSIRSHLRAGTLVYEKIRSLAQKFHAETALVAPNYRAANVYTGTWNTQAEGCGHERRVIDLDYGRGIGEVADLAPDRTAVDKYLSSIDIASPLVRHVLKTPPL